MDSKTELPAATEDQVKKPASSLSMHENVPVWYDCCSCEAEPYWAELAEDPASDNIVQSPKDK